MIHPNFIIKPPIHDELRSSLMRNILEIYQTHGFEELFTHDSIEDWVFKVCFSQYPKGHFTLELEDI
jgi:hypothetical protein